MNTGPIEPSISLKLADKFYRYYSQIKLFILDYKFVDFSCKFQVLPFR